MYQIYLNIYYEFIKNALASLLGERLTAMSVLRIPDRILITYGYCIEISRISYINRF